MTEIHNNSSPSPLLLAAAFTSIYLIWGSTYLAIRFAIETLPPFFMAGTRFLVAGCLLYFWQRAREPEIPRLSHWRAATIIGGLLLLGGNGGVSWAEQLVPSGLAALLIATVPLWMVLLDWVAFGRSRPNAGIILGLAIGFVGVVLLVTQRGLGSSPVHPLGAAVLISAALSWAIGSLYSRRANMPKSPLLSTAMEMLAGGALLIVAGVITGESTRLALDQVSALSLFSLGYLIFFGSIIAFSAYIWLLQVTTPARASTYAFVNPVVAVFLGWALAGEPITIQTLIAAGFITTAVLLITTYRSRRIATG